MLADDTGCKRRPDEAAGINNRGQALIAPGVEKTEVMIPLGILSCRSWQSIPNEIHGKRADGTAIDEMLLSDGEGGLMESLGKICDDQQRCHWHVIPDLNHAVWKDKAPLGQREESRKELAGIIGIELPEEYFENVSLSDKAVPERTIAEAEEKVDALWKRLPVKGYAEASRYVAKMSSQLLSYVRRLFKKGLVSPSRRAGTGWIERVMREIARRLKRMAFVWSQAGATKMVRIILKRFTSAAALERYWKKQLCIDGPHRLRRIFDFGRLIRQIRALPQSNLGR